jgi:hypothetical protein
VSSKLQKSPVASDIISLNPIAAFISQIGFSFSSEVEKNKWLHDIKSAIENLKINTDDQKYQYTATLKSNGKKTN